MAGYARYTALLDACVLFPVVMVDSLMSLAEAGLYAAKWTTRIEEEWIRALETKRPDLKGRHRPHACGTDIGLVEGAPVTTPAAAPPLPQAGEGRNSYGVQ